MQTYDVRSGNFVLWSPELYDVLKQNEPSVDGVKQECPLNRLTGFYACKGFSLDYLHDVLEGIVPHRIKSVTCTFDFEDLGA